MELDALDRKAAEAFPGHLVRKDLVRRFAEGLELVQEQLRGDRALPDRGD